jgi:hypothetical protein
MKVELVINVCVRAEDCETGLECVACGDTAWLSPKKITGFIGGKRAFDAFGRDQCLCQSCANAFFEGQST